jgi:hypothetical protein
MYMRISRGSFPSGTDVQKMIELNETVADALKNRPGFVSFHAGLNQQSGTFLAVTMWKDEESANFPREALGNFVSQGQALGIQLEPAESYEVNVTA